MKKALAFLVAMAMALSIAACGVGEPAASGTDLQPAASGADPQPAEEKETTAKTTTGPVPTRILEYSFHEPKEMDRQDCIFLMDCKLEVVDDTTVKATAYQYILYAQEDVENLQPGEALLVDDQLYVATDVYTLEYEENGTMHHTHCMSCAEGEIYFVALTENPPSGGEIIGFEAVFPPNTFLQAGYKTYTLDTDSFYFDVMQNGKNERLSGTELIQRLREQPEDFRLENTHIGLRAGVPECILHGEVYDVNLGPGAGY